MTTTAEPGTAGEAGPNYTDAAGTKFTPESVRVLEASAIPPECWEQYGIRSVQHPDHVPDEIDRYWVMNGGPGQTGRGPGMLFEWRDRDRTVVQFRPDKPVVDSKGETHKYILPKGCGTFLSHWRAGEPGEPVLMIEGTKQAIAGAVWAPRTWGIVAVPGCNSWVGTDLTWAEDRDIVVLFDGDVATNRDVHDAAVQLKEALEAEGASSVVFAKLAGARAKEGLDDVLGRRPADKRTDFVKRIVTGAAKKLGRPPARKSENPYMGDKGLLAQKASLAVLEGQPAALASGEMVALYRDGVFVVQDGQAPMKEKVSALLGDDYRPNWRGTIEDFLVGELTRRGLSIPDRQSEPLLNCMNGMLDLRTGDLSDHDPKYLSAQQIPIAWDPDAQCPRYLEWIQQVIPDQFEALEEVASTMLDPSRTPAKALFAFGPSHSGKSTFLRILADIAGERNMSSVTLHQLADNKFMAAPIYQKMLNVAADLSSAHVADLSLFKMMSGEDRVHADRKYGKPFQFTNQALFAFSANELPTVSETSDAYVNRVSPFLFPNSFAGREDPTIEDAIRRELPGILVRWVKAWQAFRARGGYLAVNAEVAQEFETRSDRVARWVATRCDIHPEAVDGLVGPEAGDTVTSLYVAFKQWIADDGGAAAMTRPKFAERLRSIDGVGPVRLRHRNKNSGLNVTTHTGEDREIGLSIRKAVKGGVGGVGSVGSQTSSPYVLANKEMIKVEEGGFNTQTYGKDAQQPTLPTPSHTPETASSDSVSDDDAAAFLGTEEATLPTPRGNRSRSVKFTEGDVVDFLGTADVPAPRSEDPSGPGPEPSPSAAAEASPLQQWNETVEGFFAGLDPQTADQQTDDDFFANPWGDE